MAGEVVLEAGPFAGVFDSPDPGGASRARLADAFNLYAADPKEGAAMLARHGMIGSAQQLGSGDVRQGQGLFTHRRLDGQVDRLCFGGGRMYRWDGLSTYADITPPNVIISATNPVFCATFNDEVVVSDEQNKPWVWTPATGAASLIEINTAGELWNTKGGPVVYSGHVTFLVKRVGSSELATESNDLLTTELDDVLTTEATSGFQNTLTWSNPLDPRTGYDQANFDNMWQLTQASSELLTGHAATEAGIVFFRARGVAYLTGDIDEDWRTSATRDAISATVGQDTPAALVVVGLDVWFVDLDGRVMRTRVGGGDPEELWRPARRAVATAAERATNRATVRRVARATLHEDYDVVLFTLFDDQTLYAFDAASGRYLGTWIVDQAVHVHALGTMLDANEQAVFSLLGSRGNDTAPSTFGVHWRQKTAADAKPWLDQTNAAEPYHNAFARKVETHWLSKKSVETVRLTEVTAVLVGDDQRHANKLAYRTPAGGVSSYLTAQSTASVGAQDDSDTVSFARWSLGKNAQGPMIRLLLVADHADDVQWGVHSLAARGFAVRTRPRQA